MRERATVQEIAGCTIYVTHLDDILVSKQVTNRLPDREALGELEDLQAGAGGAAQGSSSRGESPGARSTPRRPKLGRPGIPRGLPPTREPPEEVLADRGGPMGPGLQMGAVVSPEGRTRYRWYRALLDLDLPSGWGRKGLSQQLYRRGTARIPLATRCCPRMLLVAAVWRRSQLCSGTSDAPLIAQSFHDLLDDLGIQTTSNGFGHADLKMVSQYQPADCCKGPLHGGELLHDPWAGSVLLHHAKHRVQMATCRAQPVGH